MQRLLIILGVVLTLKGTSFSNENKEVAGALESLPVRSRDLIFTPDTDTNDYLGARLSTELYDPASQDWRAVNPTKDFQNGDKVRFKIKPTQDAYAYLLCKNSDGSKAVLLPSEETGGENRVRKGETVILPLNENPDSGWIFTGPPGREELVLVLARAPIDNLEHLLKTESFDFRQGETDRYKGIEESIRTIATRELYFVPDEDNSSEHEETGRDLHLVLGNEVEPKNATNWTGMVLTTDPISPIKVTVTLKHR